MNRSEIPLPEHVVSRVDMRTYPKVEAAKKPIRHAIKTFDVARWETCCGEMMVQLVHGNHTAARDLLDKFIAATQPTLATTHSHVSNVFGERWSNALLSIGIRTVGDVLSTSEARLLTIHEIGQQSVDRILQRCRDVVDGRVFEK